MGTYNLQIMFTIPWCSLHFTGRMWQLLVGQMNLGSPLVTPQYLDRALPMNISYNLSTGHVCLDLFDIVINPPLLWEDSSCLMPKRCG